MSTGFVLNIPQEMLNRLGDADKKIEKLAKTSEDAQTRIVSAFKSINTHGIDAFINKLTEAQNAIQGLSNVELNIKSGGFEGVKRGVAEVSDELQKLTVAIDAINKLIDAINKLHSIQGKNTPSSSSSSSTMTDAEKERKAYVETYEMYKRMFDQIERKRVAKEKAAEKEAKAAEASAEREARAAEKAAERERKAYEKAYKERAKQHQEANRKQLSTYGGAMDFSQNAHTINRMVQAIKYLQVARDGLSNTDSQYTQKVKALNDEIKRQKAEIDKVRNGAKELQKEHRSLMDISGQLARRLALVFSVSQITGYVKKLIEVRGEFELQQRSLQAILQNKDEANRIWQQTVDLAVRSPFRVKELVSYTKQLAAYRIESDKLFETNKMLADISAGLGVDMQRLILAFGQVRSAAYLRGTELRQFTEAGIPILEQLAQYFTELEGRAVSVGDVFERVSKRMVSFADVEEIFRRMTSEGGTFYRMQEIQAETLKGMWSNLKDSIDLMLNEIGKANEGTLKGSIQSVKELVDGWRDLAFAIKLVLVPLGTYMSVTAAIRFANNSFSQGLLLMAMNAKNASQWLVKAEKSIVGFITKMGLGKNAAAGFVKVLGGLASLGVAGIIAGIVVGLVALITKLTSASRAAKQLNKDLQAIYNEDTSNLKTQVRSFESLVSRLKDVNRGSKEHEEIIRGLNSQYGEYLGFIVDETTTYDQLASSIDSVTLALTRKAKMTTFEKAYSKTLENTNKQIAELEDRITKQAFKEGMAVGEGKTPLVPTQEEIDDIFGLIEKKVRETGEKITSYDQLNEIVSEYYGKDVEVAGTAIKNFTDITDYYLQQKEAELELDEKINDVYGDRLRSSAEARQAFADLEERQAKALKDAEKEPKWVREDIRNRFAKEKIDLEVRYEGLDEATAKLRKQALDTISATIKDVNEKIEGSIGELGEKYANLIYIDTSEASNSINEIAESTAASYKVQQDIIKQQNALKEAGTAYDAEMLENAELSAKAYYYKLQLLGRLDLLQKEEKKEEKASVKILQRRINLLKEVNRKYLELAKTFDSQTAEKKIIEAYSDTFKEAFEGTGVDLDLYKVMTNVITDARRVGEDAGGALSESMLSKLKQLETAGTYIRSATKDVIEFTKKSENFRSKAYWDSLGKIWTVGYGTTSKAGIGVKVTRDTIVDQAKAEEWLLKTYKAKESILNSILDKHRDLILTQEQYNALLDAAYNGEGAAKAIEFAYGSWEHFERYLNSLKSMKQANKKAVVVDVDEIKKEWEALDTIQEKLALTLKWSGIRTQGKVSSALQKRAMERSSMFSGDLDVAEQLETVLVRIAGMDFKTTEGMIEALSQLKKIAEKEGPEAMKILSQVISEFEAEIGLRIKKDEDKRLLDNVQELFDRYDLSLELNKLNIPPDLAKSLFDVDYLDLEGLKKAVQDRSAEFIGTDMEDEYKKFLEKIDDMEDKDAKERMKTYVKYLQEGMNERVKLKIEELRKLKEIEDFDKLTPAQKARIKANVSKEARAEQQAQEWKDFQGSEMYIMMFEDLEFLGTKALDVLKEKLEELKRSLKDLPASEVKEIIGQISKIEDITIQRNPFTSLRDVMKEVRELEAKGRTEEVLQEEFAAAELKRQSYQEELDAVTLILGAKENEIDLNRQSEEWQEKYAMYLGMQTSDLERQSMVLSALATGQGMVASNAAKDLKAYADARRALSAVSNEWGTIKSLAEKAYGSVKEVLESMGVESDSVAMSLADSAMNMVDLVFQAIMFDMQLKVMTAQAQLLGVAMNTALGPIGWIVLALQAVATVLSAIFSAKDKALQKEIDGHLARAEKLHEKYEELSDAIDSAYDASVVRQFNKEIEKTIKLEIKAIEAAIAAEKAQKASKIDWDWVDEQEKAVKDLYGTLNEEHDNYIERWGGFGSEEARFDFIESMTQAWLDSFKETGDGLAGLEEKWDEYFDNLAMKQMALRVSKAAIDQYLDMWDKYVSAESAGGEDLTEAEAQDLRLKKEQLLKDLSEKYTSLAESLGITPTTEGTGLSALSKSIQGVSESTAQVLESLLNSMRFYVADSNAKLTQLLNNMMGGETESPMLAELRAQTKWMRDIYNLINGMTATHPSGGRGIKTVM